MNRMVSKAGPVIAKLDLIVDSYSKEVTGRKFNSAVLWTNDSLVFFFIFGKWPLKVLGGDLAKRLLGVGVIKECFITPTPRSLLAKPKKTQNPNFKSAFWA